MTDDKKEIILEILKVAGIVTVGLLVPNAVQIFAKKHPKRFYRESRMKQKIKTLERLGLLKITKEGVALTLAGERSLLSMKGQSITDKQKKKWDGRWYIVMFDIWEKRRKTRDLLREELRGYGFVKIQHSIWAYPFDCTDFIALLKQDLAVGRGLICFYGELLDSDYPLRQAFGL
jgi:DNA-binding transcriptional regulator PaaX